jgi:hypothetical protein
MRKRLFDGKMPLPLRIVAWLFVAYGVISIVESLIQTGAMNNGFGALGASSVAMSVANGIVALTVGAGILFRRRFWRAFAAIVVGANCGSQLAEIFSTSRVDLLFYPQTIVILISLIISGLVLWALTDRRAHLAMRG